MKHFVTMEVTVSPSEELDDAGSESQHIINELGWITGDNLSISKIEVTLMEDPEMTEKKALEV